MLYTNRLTQKKDMKAVTFLSILVLCCLNAFTGLSQTEQTDSLYITEGFLNKFTLQKAGVSQNSYSIKQAVLDMEPETEAYTHMKKALNFERTGKVLFWTGAVTGLSFLGAQIAGVNPPSAIIYSAFGVMCLSYPFYLITKSHVKKAVAKYNSSENINKASLHWQLNSNGIGLALRF